MTGSFGAGARFTCQLDRGALYPCSSVKNVIIPGQRAARFTCLLNRGALYRTPPGCTGTSEVYLHFAVSRGDGDIGTTAVCQRHSDDTLWQHCAWTRLTAVGSLSQCLDLRVPLLLPVL